MWHLLPSLSPQEPCLTVSRWCAPISRTCRTGWSTWRDRSNTPQPQHPATNLSLFPAIRSGANDYTPTCRWFSFYSFHSQSCVNNWIYCVYVDFWLISQCATKNQYDLRGWFTQCIAIMSNECTASCEVVYFSHYNGCNTQLHFIQFWPLNEQSTVTIKFICSGLLALLWLHCGTLITLWRIILKYRNQFEGLKCEGIAAPQHEVFWGISSGSRGATYPVCSVNALGSPGGAGGCVRGIEIGHLVYWGLSFSTVFEPMLPCMTEICRTVLVKVMLKPNLKDLCVHLN